MAAKDGSMSFDFEAETINPEELQQAGWQAILDNFNRYTDKEGDLPYSHR